MPRQPEYQTVFAQITISNLYYLNITAALLFIFAFHSGPASRSQKKKPAGSQTTVLDGNKSQIQILIQAALLK